MKDLLWPLHATVNPSSYLKGKFFPEMGEMTVKILARINNSLQKAGRMDPDSFYPDDFCTGYVARGFFLSAFMGAGWRGHVVYLDGFSGGAGGSPAEVAFYHRSL